LVNRISRTSDIPAADLSAALDAYSNPIRHSIDHNISNIQANCNIVLSLSTIGDIYETMFSIPVDLKSIIQYFGGGDQKINGPNAIAVFPDESVLIADPVGYHLLHYSKAGSLFSTIELEHLWIKYVADLRIKEALAPSLASFFTDKLW
jgi:hypothetical protein